MKKIGGRHSPRTSVEFWIYLTDAKRELILTSSEMSFLTMLQGIFHLWECDENKHLAYSFHSVFQQNSHFDHACLTSRLREFAMEHVANRHTPPWQGEAHGAEKRRRNFDVSEHLSSQRE